MKDGPSILLVEDDSEIGDLVSRYLRKHEMEVTIAPSGKAMDAAFANRDFDLLILDIHLPGEDGLSICRRIRMRSNLPIVIVTAQGDDVDKIVGLEVGADDYIVKPFNPRELLARLRAVMRRAHASTAIEPARHDGKKAVKGYGFAGWTVDLLTRQVMAPSGVEVALRGAEFDLLFAFCEHPNRILSRDQLITLIHGRITGPMDRSIDVHISRLRQKLEDDPKNPKFIVTVRAEGYMFASQVARL